MRRLWAIAGLLLVSAAIVWGVQALSEPLGWHWADIPSARTEGAPAACEAAALLRQTSASRLAAMISREVYPGDALADVSAALATTFDSVRAAERSQPLRVDVTWDGMPYRWLVTALVARSPVAGQPGVASEGIAAIVLLNPEVGTSPAVLTVAGAGLPASSCPFNWRDWAVETLRSPITLALGGGLLAWLAAGAGLRIAGRRSRTQTEMTS